MEVLIYSSTTSFSSVAESCLTLWNPMDCSVPGFPVQTPGACSNSCPSSWWCHPTISSSVIPFSCLQSFPASVSFPVSQFFVSGGQSITTSFLIFIIVLTSLVAQRVKCLSTMRETWVRSLGREDPLEKEMAIHSSTIAWKIPWTEEPGRLQSMGLQRVGHHWTTSLSLFTFNLYHHLIIQSIIRFSHFFPQSIFHN